MKALKKIPKFQSERQEADFWDKHNSAEYVNWSKAKRTIFPNLKPTTRSVPVRLPEGLLFALKSLANKHSTSYQALLRGILEKAVEKELRLSHK